MIARCESCGAIYDDARSLTYCPHAEFLTEEERVRKDYAITLMEGRVRFARQANTGPDYRIVSVGWNGMVSLHEIPGEFTPSLFVKVVDHHTVR